MTIGVQSGVKKIDGRRKGARKARQIYFLIFFLHSQNLRPIHICVANKALRVFQPPCNTAILSKGLASFGGQKFMGATRTLSDPAE